MIAGHLCVSKFAARLGNRTPEFACGFNPLVDYDLSVRNRFGIRLTISHAARQFWNLNDKTVIVFAPVYDQFVMRAHSLDTITFAR